MFSAIDICMFGTGIILLLMYLFFFIKGMKYKNYFDIYVLNEDEYILLDEDEYIMKDIYIVGLAVLETIHYSYTSKYDRILRRDIDIFYGKKYEDFYLSVIRSQQISLSFTLLVFGFCLYGLAGDPTVVFVMILFAGLAYYYFGASLENKLKKRSESMLNDFSEMVSKLALLTNAGLILKEAWEIVAYNGDSCLYQEMQLSVIDMQNGLSDVDAISKFASRSMLPEIRKFCSTIVQGLEKGNQELVYMLQEQSRECWNLKQQLVRRQGEKASSKLMIPMAIMFIGILVMVVVPIFTNMGT